MLFRSVQKINLHFVFGAAVEAGSKKKVEINFLDLQWSKVSLGALGAGVRVMECRNQNDRTILNSDSHPA